MKNTRKMCFLYKRHITYEIQMQEHQCINYEAKQQNTVSQTWEIAHNAL